jgi:putative membrane protein
MNTTKFLLGYWHLNIMAILVIVLMIAFHYITNGYRFSRRSPLFFSAVILFILVTISPLDFLSKYYLFSAHMVQHIVLLLIIPPLILSGTDKDFLEKVFRSGFLKKAGNFLFYPLVAWFLGVGSMWIMHLPAFMMKMNDSAFLMDTQMIILPVLGWFFIWPVYSPISFRRLEPLQSSAYLFLACVGCTVLGILITFAPADMFTGGMQPENLNLIKMIHSDWGINDSTDQMMGGLIMWVPACIIYLTNIMIILLRWFAGAAAQRHDGTMA